MYDSSESGEKCAQIKHLTKTVLNNYIGSCLYKRTTRDIFFSLEEALSWIMNSHLL